MHTALTVTIFILAALLWGAALATLRKRRVLSPLLSYIALFLTSLAKSPAGYPIVPLNTTILTGWLFLAATTMLSTILETPEERRNTEGTGYITVGAIAGMIVGLLGFSATEDISMRYSIMIIATAAGGFFGYLLYRNTPGGRQATAGQPFFRPLLGKAFPSAITIMQLGTVLVLLVSLYS